MVYTRPSLAVIQDSSDRPKTIVDEHRHGPTGLPKMVRLTEWRSFGAYKRVGEKLGDFQLADLPIIGGSSVDPSGSASKPRGRLVSVC